MAKLNTWYSQGTSTVRNFLYQLDLRVAAGGRKGRLTIVMVPEGASDASVVTQFRDAEKWIDVQEIHDSVVNEKLGKEGKVTIIKDIFFLMRD